MMKRHSLALAATASFVLTQDEDASHSTTPDKRPEGRVPGVVERGIRGCQLGFGHHYNVGPGVLEEFTEGESAASVEQGVSIPSQYSQRRARRQRARWWRGLSSAFLAVGVASDLTGPEALRRTREARLYHHTGTASSEDI
jgi:hypothetical protein